MINEIEEALDRHELLKIKLPAVPAQERRAVLTALCNATGADLVQTIGRVGVIFRAAEEPGIELPD